MLIHAKIDFKKPRHNDMQRQGFTSVDMHLHTKYSDGTRKIPSVVKKAKKMGVGVAITDHNEIRGAIEIAKYADILSIPGIEATTKEGIHLLYYFYNVDELSEFYNHNILPNKENGSHFLNMPFLEFLEIAKDYNCLACAPHPYGMSWTGICSEAHSGFVTKQAIKSLGAIEVINGAALKHMNQSAMQLAEELKSGVTGGSDGHRLFELGKVLTYTKYPADRESFLNSIKEKKNFVIGKETNMVQKIATHSSKIAIPVKHPLIYAKQGYNYLMQKV